MKTISNKKGQTPSSLSQQKRAKTAKAKQVETV